MKTKMIISAIILLVLPIAIYAQHPVTPQKAQLVLKDSTLIEGYLRTMPSNVDSVISLSEKPNSKTKRYGTSRIAYLKVLEYDDKFYNPSPHSDNLDANLVGVWVPMYINNEIGEVGQVWRDQALLMKTYEGKNVCGFIGWDHFRGYRCYYKLPNNWYAKAFFPLKKMDKHRKKILLQEFEKYSEIVNKINSGELSDKAISENPFILLKELDEILNEVNL